ncbi:ATP-binding protein [uncultured Mitsuokella sp.]|uniref:ATP-binding protein n=1 Tax=uncultured Mitsuokella sp. TaxID=453120 RepID=UPI0025DC6A13|nr:ATP-binding protein [uncultured Mitsuokella sp.]
MTAFIEAWTHKNEITVDELNAIEADKLYLVDIRDEAAFERGSVTGALNLNPLELQQGGYDLPEDKLIVCICMWGKISLGLADNLRKLGYTAVSLQGGYALWLQKKLEKETAAAAVDDKRLKHIENSLRKKYKRKISGKFVETICDYKLVEPGDKIAICISGGKDSMLMAKLFQELKRHNKIPFELVFLCMDPGYNEMNRHIIEENAKLLQIPLTFFSTDIFESVFHVEESPCYLCAKMRRGYLYRKARELGCNKIALGHHFDDVIETNLMSMLYSGAIRTMMPKVRSTSCPGMELIRPLYRIREADIKSWRDDNGLYFIQCACKFTETCSTCHTDGTTDSKRLEVKKLIAKLAETNPQVPGNIFHAMENVNLDTVLQYKQNGKDHSFMGNY